MKRQVSVNVHVSNICMFFETENRLEKDLTIHACSSLFISLILFFLVKCDIIMPFDYKYCDIYILRLFDNGNQLGIYIIVILFWQ